MDNSTIIFELAKKYTFENFDFKNKSIEDLFASYQENADKLNQIIKEKNAEIHKADFDTNLNILRGF